MPQRTNKHLKFAETKLPNMTIYVDHIVESRGRGVNAEYYVRLAGDSADFVWLKALQIDRELIVDFNRRKVREKRAEARRLKTVQPNKEHNRIDKYFKVSQASPLVEGKQSRLSSSQPKHLSEYLMKEEEKNEEQVASPEPDLLEPVAQLPYEAAMIPNDDLPTVDWLMEGPEVEQNEPDQETMEDQQLPEFGQQSPAKVPGPRTNELDLVRCNVCQQMKVKSEQTLLSICGHMHMCFDCAASIFVNMLRSDCLICNQMDSFALHMFEVIKYLTCHLIATGGQNNSGSLNGPQESAETPPRSPPPPSSMDN